MGVLVVMRHCGVVWDVVVAYDVVGACEMLWVGVRRCGGV